MFGWIKRLVFGSGREKHWGAICGFVLGQDQFADLRDLKPIYASLVDGLGDSVSHIAEGRDVAEQADRARGELVICTKALGFARRFVLLDQDKRRALALEYWPGQELSDDAAIQAASTNYHVLLAKVMCLAMILDDIVKPKKESWWSDYLLLTIADPDSPVIELAEMAIKTGNGLGQFSEQIAKAKTELKMLSAASRDI